MADRRADFIGFRPHLRAYVLSESEVALIGETERIALRGRAYAQIAPLLDGTRSSDDVVIALRNDLAPESAYTAIARLETRGLTTTGSVCRAASSGAETSSPNPTELPAILPGVRISVTPIGLPDTMVEAFADKLRTLASSCSREDRNPASAPIEVCLVDDYLRPELAERVADARAAGHTLLPVRPAGQMIWLGPFVGPGSALRWSAFDRRMRDNRPADIAILAGGHRFPIVPIALTPETLDLGLSLAAAMATCCASGDVPEIIDGAVWTVDASTFVARSHALPLAGPEGYPTRPARHASPVVLPPHLKRFTADGGHRTCTPEETLERLQPLISPVTGIVHGIEKTSTSPNIHLFTATQNWPGKSKPLRNNRLLGNPAGAGGKGQTEIQAKVSCIAEAVERYSCGFFGDEPSVSGPLGELEPAAIHPNDIMLFSANQYARRDGFNESRQEGSYNWIPEPFDPHRSIAWTPVWSLSRRRSRLVPSTLCYFGYNRRDEGREHVFARTNSNGCAAGNTLPEAILQGLLELIERDACALWWYNRARRPTIDLGSFRHPYFDEMTAHYDSLGRTLHVLDLRTDVGLPVAMAVSWLKANGGEIHLGLGCHLEPRLAVSRALTELNQVAYSGVSDALSAAASQTFDRDHLQWLKTATIESEPYVVSLDHQVVGVDEMTDHSSDDVSDDVRHCVSRLDALGLETLVLDHTRPEVGFPTARVIVPGLRHFWARLAPGRLYDVPEALGWVTVKCREADLNPIPFFL